MTDRTSVHRLLWGIGEPGAPPQTWELRPTEVPTLGLPTRVATHLFVQALDQGPPAEWDAQDGPLTWALTGSIRMLGIGRQLQLGVEPGREGRSGGDDGDPADVAARLSDEWEVLAHPAFVLPFVAQRMEETDQRAAYAVYCNVLLLLIALDGGEAILDGLVRAGVGTIPYEDRWAWRSRIHLPRSTWTFVEKALRWGTGAELDPKAAAAGLVHDLRPAAARPVALQDFECERVDIVLSLTNEKEVVRSVSREGEPSDDLPKALWLPRRKTKTRGEVGVRIAQVSKWPEDWVGLRGNFPKMDRGSVNEIMAQVASAFQAPQQTRDGSEPELVVLPEVLIPQSEISTVRDLVRVTGRASLAGLYWRVLPPSVLPGPGSAPSRRWFVNEAELVVPINPGSRGPTSVRYFRVQKPVPAHVEVGLERALSAAKHLGASWKIQRGRRWYRFVHPRWGDFSIAICSDLLESAPWRSLRGELLHLFMVGFNPDVDLFDSLTWVRAYENYVNLVSTNHGRYGGSFLWTPRRKYDRELARLRGSMLYLVADVSLPVGKLFQEQLTGVEKAEERGKDLWKTGDSGDAGAFKAPPPGFRRRAVT